MITFTEYLVEKKEDSKSLVEAYDGSSILPAGRVLFNKNKVTPDQVAKSGTWDKQKYTIEHHKTSDGKMMHVVTHGEGNDVGTSHNFHHDQHGYHIAHTTLVGKSRIENNEVHHVSGEDHTKTNASIHVYK